MFHFHPVRRHQSRKAVGDGLGNDSIGAHINLKSTLMPVTILALILFSYLFTVSVTPKPNKDLGNRHQNLTGELNAQSPTDNKQADQSIQNSPSTPADIQNQQNTNSDSVSSNVTVNGQKISVPDNGVVNKTIYSGNDSTTSVHLYHSSSGNSQSQNNSSLNVSINSDSKGGQ